jgi:hypothetical protein
MTLLPVVLLVAGFPIFVILLATPAIVIVNFYSIPPTALSPGQDYFDGQPCLHRRPPSLLISLRTSPPLSAYASVHSRTCKAPCGLPATRRPALSASSGTIPRSTPRRDPAVWRRSLTLPERRREDRPAGARPKQLGQPLDRVL